MPTIISLITTLATVLLTALGGQNLISASLQKILQSLLTAAAGLFTDFTSGKTAANALAAVLATLESLDQALASETGLDPVALAQANEAMLDLQAAIQAYQAAEVTTDPSTLTPLPVVE